MSESLRSFQCPELSNYVELFLLFRRDRQLKDEILAHVKACPICTALRSATEAWRRAGGEYETESMGGRRAETVQ